MEEFKGTKGNWKAHKIDLKDYKVVAVSSYPKNTVLTHIYLEDGKITKEHLANAKLIAAAPDLFEALSEFMKYHESDFFKLIADDGRVKSAWVEKAQKAINKAFGK